MKELKILANIYNVVFCEVNKLHLAVNYFRKNVPSWMFNIYLCPKYTSIWRFCCGTKLKTDKESYLFLKKKNKFYCPFLWMVFICLKATDPLRGDSVLFTIQFSVVPGMPLINLGKMKG